MIQQLNQCYREPYEAGLTSMLIQQMHEAAGATEHDQVQIC